MKIKEICEMGEDDNGLPILAISEGCVVGIGAVNQEKEQQLIAVDDGSGNVIKVALLNKDLFLLKGTEGITVSFKSGPPIKNKPTGIVFRWTPKGGRVEVSSKAIMILHGESNVEETPKEKELLPSKLTENNLPSPPKTCIPQEVEFIGFNDDYFRGKLEERRHLFEMVRVFNEEYRLGWPVDTMSQIATSLIMDGIHNGKTVLKIQQVRKEKFQAIEKPHNPEPVKEHPVADPVHANIVDFLEGHKNSGWAQVEVANGTPIIKALQDDVRRGGMMHFYFSCKASGTQLKGKNKERYDAIELFIDELPRSLEAAMALEAMLFDVAKANNLDYIKDSEKVEELAEKEAAKYAGAPVRSIVMQYLKSVN